MRNIEYLKYTLRHKKAFLETEKRLLGRNTLSGYLHDLDKVFLYLLPIHKDKIQTIHRSISKHHAEYRGNKNYLEMVIDWECARITKPDKPLNAYDTLHKFYHELIDIITPILIKLGINKSDRT